MEIYGRTKWWCSKVILRWIQAQSQQWQPWILRKKIHRQLNVYPMKLLKVQGDLMAHRWYMNKELQSVTFLWLAIVWIETPLEDASDAFLAEPKRNSNAAMWLCVTLRHKHVKRWYLFLFGLHKAHLLCFAWRKFRFTILKVYTNEPHNLLESQSHCYRAIKGSFQKC